MLNIDPKYGSSNINTPFLESSKSIPLIISLRLGIWLITFAAQIRSVEFLNFDNFLQFFSLKNLFETFTLFIFFEYLATLEDGSKPKC